MARVFFGTVVLLVTGLVPVSAQQVTPVRVAETRVESLQRHHRVTGTLRAVSRARVAAMEDGRVIKVHVQHGDRIKAGQVLVVMDDRRLQAQLAEAQAERTVAEAEVLERQAERALAKQNRDRAQQLVGRQAISQQDIESRESALKVTEARVASAQRRLEATESRIDLIEVRLQDTTITAPFDGHVVERHVEPGEWIHPGDPVVTLVSDGTIEAWLEVPERFATQLGDQPEGLQVLVSGNGKSIEAQRVRRISDVDPRSRLFYLVVELNNTDDGLSPGMSAESWLPLGTAQQHTVVPKDALVRSGQSTIVYQTQPQDGGHVAVPVPVRVLFETGDRVVLRDGDLSEGAIVVVEGNERLIPGTPVMIAGTRDDGDAPTAQRSPPGVSR